MNAYSHHDSSPEKLRDINEEEHSFIQVLEWWFMLESALVWWCWGWYCRVMVTWCPLGKYQMCVRFSFIFTPPAQQQRTAQRTSPWKGRTVNIQLSNIYGLLYNSTNFMSFAPFAVRIPIFRHCCLGLLFYVCQQSIFNCTPWLWFKPTPMYW